VQYKNCYRYYFLRSGRQLEGRVQPSQFQSGVQCMCITGIRVLYLCVGLDVDDDVKYIERSGGLLIAELGFAFKAAGRKGQLGRKHTKTYVAPKYRFSVPDQVLHLSPSASHELPSVPDHGPVPLAFRLEVLITLITLAITVFPLLSNFHNSTSTMLTSIW